MSHFQSSSPQASATIPDFVSGTNAMFLSATTGPGPDTFSCDEPFDPTRPEENVCADKRQTNVFLEPVEDSVWPLPLPVVHIAKPRGATDTSLWYEI